MTTAVLTPFTRTPAQAGGSGLWRKRVLPVGEVEYKGRQLKFTKTYNDQLAAAFSDGAYDQVPFQLADAANTHTNDPDRFRGDIVAMDSREDGLWITVKPTSAGHGTLLTNPNLGVSARIVEEYNRSDGKFYPAAVQHVLGTLDPRIPGLGAWQPIEAANQPDMIIDLSGAEFSGEEGGTPMPDVNNDRLRQLLDLPQDQWDALVAGGTIAPLSEAELTALGVSGEPDATGDPETDAILAWIDGMSPDELAALEGEMVADAAATGLTAEALGMIDMANYRADETAAQLSAVQQRLDAQSYLDERRRIATDYGIPPRIVDFARPLLEGSGHVVELANGQGVDAGAIVRKIFEEVGSASRLLDLGVELGSPMDEPEQHQQAATARSDVVSRFRSQTGI